MTKLSTSLPRGIRNNNPLNIRISRWNDWLGKVPLAENSDRDFEQFRDPVMGIRAGASLILRHYRRGLATSVGKLIAIWAPSQENDTRAYAEAVCKASDLGVEEDVDFSRYEIIRPVVEAMIRVENGSQPYSCEVIDAGLELAGIQKPVAQGGKEE